MPKGRITWRVYPEGRGIGPRLRLFNHCKLLICTFVSERFAHPCIFCMKQNVLLNAFNQCDIAFGVIPIHIPSARIICAF